MSELENKNQPEKSGTAEALPPQYLERKWPLKDVSRVESDFALPLLASQVRHARKLLEKLAESSFGWTEILLAGASLLIGAVFGVLPSEMKFEAKLLPILFFCVFPVLGGAMLVAYFFSKRSENLSTRETATRLLDALPKVPDDSSDNGPSDARIVFQLDTQSGSAEVPVPDVKDLPTRTLGGVLSADDLAKMTDHDLLYRFAVALMENEREISDQIDKYQRGRVEFHQPVFSGRWEADSHYWRIVTNRGGDFDKMKALADGMHPDAYICNNIAAVYRWNKEYEASAEWLRRAAANAETLSSKIEYLNRAADRLLEADDKLAALSLYEEISAMPGGDEAAARVRAEGAAVFLGLQKQQELEVAVLEYGLQQNPVDYSARFSLAYKYGQLGRRSLSAFHYTLIPSDNRDAMAWNNLGVSWRELNITGSAADAYQRAHDLDESLATSNLANLMIDAGLYVQAKKLIAKTLKEEHNLQLDRTVVRLDEAIEADDEKRKALLESARQESVFFKRLGRSATLPAPAQRAGVYADGEFVLTLRVDKFEIVGSAVRTTPTNKLAIALAGGDEHVTVQQYSVKGQCIGAAVVLELRLEEAGKIVSLLGVPIKFLAFFDGDAIECIDSSSVEKWKTRKFLRHMDPAVVPAQLA